MERRQRSLAARRKTVRGLVFALALAVTGCGTTSIHLQGSGVSAPGFVPPGTSVSGGSVGVNFQGASTAAALIGIVMLGAATHAPEVSPPVMDETRRVQLVDCTQPIADWSANLRCR